MRILFICKRRLDVEKQKTYGLETSASLIVRYLQSQGVEVEIGRAQDANDIDRLVTKADPSHVVLEALWVTPDKMKEILSIKRHQKRKWIVRIHSRLSFLANEGIALPWLVGYREKVYPITDNLWIAPNAKDAANDLRDTLRLQTVYLPNIYCPPEYELVPKTPEPGVINIGIFGAIRPMKNHLLQCVAAIRYAESCQLKARVHINDTRMEQRGENCLKNIDALFLGQNSKHELVKHEWMTHQEFVGLITNMDLTMQVSFSETFNIVAADSIYHNVPCIGSTTIDWLPSVWQVADPNNSEEVVERMAQSRGVFGRAAMWYARRSLLKWNSAAESRWTRFLAE